MDHVNFALPLQEFEPGEEMYPERHYYDMVDAKYVKHGSIIDNPDLNALPKMSDQGKLLDMSKVGLPGYDYEEVRKMPSYERKEAILNLQTVLHPLMHILEMGKAVSDALTSSYLSRAVKVNASRTALMSMRSGLGGRPLSFVVVGTTGVGKSVAIDQILNLYPKAIHHVLGDIEYTQIPILKVTALVGNMAELMCSIAIAIDDIIGNGPLWQQHVNKNNLGLAASAIKEAIKTYHVGLIIIDESQFIKFNGSHASVENLIGISEDTGCALGFIGNRDLLPKMNKYPRFVSRTMTRIEISIADEESQKYFKGAIQHMWKYQWTKEYTKLTRPIMDELLKASMYNICILKSLLMKIQSEAIKEFPKDGITPEYIRTISEKYYSNIRMLVLDDSEEAEMVLHKKLAAVEDEIKDDAEKLKRKAYGKLLEEQQKRDELWGEGRYEQLEQLVKPYGINAGNLKKVTNKMLLTDPGLTKRDLAVVAADVKRYVEEHTKDVLATGRQQKREYDARVEEIVQNAVVGQLAETGLLEGKVG